MAHFIKIAAVMLILAFTSNAQAVLIGEDVTGVLTAPGFGTPINQTQTVVDPGQEFALNVAGTIGADLFDTSLTLSIDLASGSASIGANLQWDFTLVNPDLTFTGVTETFDDFAAGASFLGISNGGKTISFSIVNQTITAPGHSASYDLSVLDSSAAVPAPAPLALMALGLLGLAARRKV